MSFQQPQSWLGRARQARLPQVLGVYLAACFGAIQLLDIFIDRFGLPDWFFPAAIGLLIIGVPILLATALLQAPHRSASPREIMPGFESNQLSEDDAGGARAKITPHVADRHWLTWRRALLGGAGAFAVLLATTGGYLGLRAAGIGPVGSLLAKGVLKQNDRILIADFHSSPGDSAYAQALTEAFRVDFAQTQAVTVVPPDRVRSVLRLMQKPAGSRLDAALAREVALRGGIRGVVAGELTRVGKGFVVSAQLVAPDSGNVLAAYREEAADSAKLLSAIDKLSKKLRGKIGESLRAIRANEDLAQVTTPSLEALRKYSQAMRASAEGKDDGAITLLQEAIALDTTFAMAYRKLAVLLSNSGSQPSAWLDASARAYQLRDHLTEPERYITEGMYFQYRRQFDKATEAYERLLEDYPGDPIALNNLALRYLYERDYPRADAAFKKAIDADSGSVTPYTNLLQTQEDMGDMAGARQTLAVMRAHFPGSFALNANLVQWFASLGQYDSARTVLESMQKRLTAPAIKMRVARSASSINLVEGRLARARQDVERQSETLKIASPFEGLRSWLRLAEIDALIRNDPASAMTTLQRGLAQYPLDSIRPEDRPYLRIAGLYAAMSKVDLARATLQSYDRTIAEQIRALDQPARRRTEGMIALAERRGQDALANFRAGDEGYCQVCTLPMIARAFDSMGRADSATIMFEKYVTTPDQVRLQEDAFSLPYSYERLGDLYLAANNKQKAAHYYNAFIKLWKDADPELQPRVQAARRRLEALGADRPR